MKRIRIQLQWSEAGSPGGFRTGVSLHSHTLHSRESLDCLYKVAKSSAVLRAMLRRAEAQYRKFYRDVLDLRRGWWTPPLAPLDAYRVEAEQIESFGLEPMVSLTDHDDIEAPISVQAVNPTRDVPVSVEWTVPYGPTFFHIGVHNIRPSRAREMMAALAAYTEHPHCRGPREILAALHASPGVLLVFNHPLWDEKGIGVDVHRRAALDFLHQCGRHLHAIEINGLRPWSENRQAIRLANEWDKPVVSGGDRHAVEPNSMLNFTNAVDFAEFAQEVRDGASHIFIASSYRHGHGIRMLHNILDVLQPYDNHGFGWREWQDRVFYQGPDDAVRSLRELWDGNPPGASRVLSGVLRLAGHGTIRKAVRATYGRAEHLLL